MGCFIQRRSSQLVTASADPALHISFAGFVTPGRQAEVRADVSRSAKAFRQTIRVSLPLIVCWELVSETGVRVT
jgi:hypothetical protein